MASQRGEGKRLNKLRGRVRHHHMDIERVLLKRAHQLCRLVRGYAAGDSDRNFHTAILRDSGSGKCRSGTKRRSLKPLRLN